jgi:hypothetical protein
MDAGAGRVPDDHQQRRQRALRQERADDFLAQREAARALSLSAEQTAAVLEILREAHRTRSAVYLDNAHGTRSEQQEPGNEAEFQALTKLRALLGKEKFVAFKRAERAAKVRQFERQTGRRIEMKPVPAASSGRNE